MLERIVPILAGLCFIAIGAWYFRNAEVNQTRTLQAIARRRGVWWLLPSSWSTPFVQRRSFVRNARISGAISIGVGAFVLLLVAVAILTEGWNPHP
jgi:hypothetical protein